MDFLLLVAARAATPLGVLGPPAKAKLKHNRPAGAAGTQEPQTSPAHPPQSSTSSVPAPEDKGFVGLLQDSLWELLARASV